MKTILVPVERQPSSLSVLEAALLLAREVDGYMEGFALGPEIPNFYAMDVPVVLPDVLDEPSRRERVSSARKEFESLMQAQRVPGRFGEPMGLSFGWQGHALQGDWAW